MVVSKNTYIFLSSRGGPTFSSGEGGHASDTQFKWRFAGGPIMAHFKWYLDPPSTHQQKNIKNGKV